MPALTINQLMKKLEELPAPTREHIADAVVSYLHMWESYYPGESLAREVRKAIVRNKRRV